MTWQRVLSLIIWLSLLAGAVVAVGLILLFHQSKPPQFTSPASSSPATVQAAEERVRDLQQEMRRVLGAEPQPRSQSAPRSPQNEERNPAATGKARADGEKDPSPPNPDRVGPSTSLSSFTFRIRDEEINTYFAAHPEELRALHPDLRAVELHFRQPASVSFRAWGTYQDREMSLQVEGTVGLVEGRQIRMTVQQARLGALPLAGGWREKLAEQINRALAHQLKDLPPHVRLESLSMTDGELILQGQVTGPTEEG